MLLQEPVEVSHKLIDRVPHVHMSNVRPNRIRVGEFSFLGVEVAEGGLELISEGKERRDERGEVRMCSRIWGKVRGESGGGLKREGRKTHLYVFPSSTGSKSFTMA